jgi:hypothetical protein
LTSKSGWEVYWQQAEGLIQNAYIAIRCLGQAAYHERTISRLFLLQLSQTDTRTATIFLDKLYPGLFQRALKFVRCVEASSKGSFCSFQAFYSRN